MRKAGKIKYFFVPLAIFVSLALPVASMAQEIHLEGSASFWWLVHEEVENGKIQQSSGDYAAQEASGFNFSQGRLGVRFLSEGGAVEGLLRLRLEERTDIIDAWGAYHFRPWLNFQVGLMKIPATSEILQSDSDIDFISRTTYAETAGDYALSTTPYISLLMNTESKNRDMGMALKGRFPGDGKPAVKYFFMVSNGTGGNLYVGGKESQEYFYTNNFGDHLYGGRVEVLPIEGVMIGSHYSRNRHVDAIFKDKKAVFDLDRISWSVDGQVKTPWLTKLYAFYAEGSLEDFWFASEYEFDWKGWGVWLMQGFWNGAVEVGVRYDIFLYEYDDDGNEKGIDTWTYGINLVPSENSRIQINYMDKFTIDDFSDDLDDNVLFVNFQFRFQEGLLLASP